MSDLETSPITVAILTPCQDTVSAGYAYDLARLVARVAREHPEITVTLFQSRGTLIPQQRESLVTAAKQTGATHLLWLDADMRFPNDTLTRLLAHDEPIVAANYPTRRPPILPTAEDRELGKLFTSADSTGLVQVSHCGMGLMLVHARVFDLPEPWFSLGFNPSDKTFVGEDVFFCRKATTGGFAVLIDQDLSKEIRHIGEMEFRAEHACLTRQVHNSTAEPNGTH